MGGLVTGQGHKREKSYRRQHVTAYTWFFPVYAIGCLTIRSDTAHYEQIRGFIAFWRRPAYLCVGRRFFALAILELVATKLRTSARRSRVAAASQ